ncbi:NAD(P)-dependent oxidoreductase [Jatrophihabitans telluris]|uniref:NAD(P)-dependent oxidoreductase n=1 Tax=Jatrophihabitans telluris TaxID=2038343 RepID=A0ABY4QZC5_9ACTN|nr:NAD(P)-dependent oxidoreductase [Jatrophihabitans telluris]
MGGQIARHLLEQQWSVLGFDVCSAALTELSDRGGRVAASPAALASSVDVVITSLPSTAALWDVVRGPTGLVSGSRPGLTVVETSTMTSAAKRAVCDELRASAVVMLDCPLSGTAAQMAQGDVAVYASGDQDAVQAQWQLFKAFTRSQYNLGTFGNGSDVKLLSNLLVTVHNVAAAEAIVLARRAGLAADRVLEALADGAGTSRMLEVRGPLMVMRQYSQVSASLDEFMKDIELISAFGAEAGSALPLFEVCAGLYRTAVEAGFGAEDHAVVAEVIANLTPAARLQGVHMSATGGGEV